MYVPTFTALYLKSDASGQRQAAAGLVLLLTNGHGFRVTAGQLRYAADVSRIWDGVLPHRHRTVSSD